MDPAAPPRRSRLRGAASFVAGAVVAYAVVATLAFVVPPPYHHAERPLPASFDVFVVQRLADSRRAGVRPGNEERLVRHAPGRTPVAILYVHGFGASRGEGQLVADSVAAWLGANLYYLRLPGHGTTMDDHASHGYAEYLDTAEDALAMMPKLGERTIVIATSAGGAIATWLAARHPDRVDALILASPFYAFHDPASVLLTLPGGMAVVHALHGRVRDTRGPDPEHRVGPGRERFWQVRQRYSALSTLDRMRRVTSRPEVFRRVTAPVLLFYWHRDAEHEDHTASLPAMHAAFALFGRAGSRSPLDREVAVADGEHVLFSEHIRSDKRLVLSESRAFLTRAGFRAAGGAAPTREAPATR